MARHVVETFCHLVHVVGQNTEIPLEAIVDSDFDITVR